MVERRLHHGLRYRSRLEREDYTTLREQVTARYPKTLAQLANDDYRATRREQRTYRVAGWLALLAFTVTVTLGVIALKQQRKDHKRVVYGACYVFSDGERLCMPKRPWPAMDGD